MPSSAETIPAILAIDTAATSCSVALGITGGVHFREERRARQHAAVLLPMVDAVLAEAGCELAALDAIAVNCGPGSFTGLRIGVSAAQGLAIGGGLPSLPVSALQALAFAARYKYGVHQGPVVTAIDARMGEIYTACWGVTGDVPHLLIDEQVCSPDAVALPAGYDWRDTLLVGNGTAMVVAAIAAAEDAQHDEHLVHSAREVLAIAQTTAQGSKPVDAEKLEPVYLRNRVTG